MATNGNGNGKAGDSAAAPSSSAPQSVAAQRASMTQALEELTRGERTAAKLENELQAFEAKLDSLLTSLGMTAADLDEAEEKDKPDTAPSNGTKDGKP